MNNSILENTENQSRLKHVAIIMDGNGRWAKQKGHERTFGHRNAITAVKSAIEGCRDVGIPYLTLYAFSTENWNRPKREVSFLMTLLAKSIKTELEELHENDIKLNVIGDLTLVPNRIVKELNKAIDYTQNNSTATLTLALSYGSKFELLQATQNIARKVKNGDIDISDIDEELFTQHLYTHDLPEVDLLIRTSGEHRISNFLLWQIAYAELYFTEVLWPDFRKEHLFEAVKEFNRRERRYGKTGEQLKTE